MLYLGNAIVYIYRAAICPDTEPLGCTEPVAYAVTVPRRQTSKAELAIQT